MKNKYEYEKKETGKKSGTPVNTGPEGNKAHEKACRECNKKKHAGRKGIMTVEAALVLPLFLIAMILIGYILNMYYVHRIVGTELDNACRAISAYAYPAQTLKNELETGDSNEKNSGQTSKVVTETESTVKVYDDEELSEVFIQAAEDSDSDSGDSADYWSEIAGLGSSVAVSAYVTGQVNKDPIAASLISGGISCVRSKILTDGSTVDLIAEYTIKLPVSFLDIGKMRFLQRSRMQAWVGYEIPGADSEEDDETYVYVTENGRVYHLTETCTYLKPSVRAVSAGTVKGLRNTSGGKYYPCEVCNASKNPKGTVYITTYGTRYHTSSSCSAIERNYKKVPLSEVKDLMPACSKCGGSK